MLAVTAPPSVQARRAGRRQRGGRRWHAATAGLCAVLLAGCGDDPSGVHTLAPSQVHERVGASIEWKASAEERHGLSARDFAAAPTTDAEGAEGPGLHWRVPSGWAE